MRVALLTEGGYPYAGGEGRLWCDRLVRGLGRHEFDVYALSRDERQEALGRLALPPQVARVRTAPLWGTGGTAPHGTGGRGRRARRRARAPPPWSRTASVPPPRPRPAAPATPITRTGRPPPPPPTHTPHPPPPSQPSPAPLRPPP
ncbi:DUF3492 domain-containing protein, partial [Streptomyces sp. G44]|nr:DUF3492 domain-containing protein [Streptomyces sp. G44]